MIVTVEKVDLVIRGKDKQMANKIILGLILLVIASGAWCYVYLGQIEQQNIEEAEQLTERTKKVSSILSAKVTTWRGVVEELAKSPALIASLNSSEQALENWVVEQKWRCCELFGQV